MSKETINIGITLGIKSKEENMWINGIKMNAIFLLDMLMRSSKNYNAYIINTYPKLSVNEEDVKIPWDTNKYRIYDYNKVAAETDILIMLGTSLDKDSILAFKKSGNRKRKKKVIAYKCGNNYVIDMERAIFADEEKDKLNLAAWSYGACDDVWMVPQQEYQNKHYYDLFEEVDSKVVPFVWSPMFLDESQEIYIRNEKTIEYQPSEGKKRIVSFEPNMNVVKYAMIPALIVETLYRKTKKLIEYFVICSGMRIGVRTGFVTHVKQLEVFKDDILKVDGRYPLPGYLCNKTDIVISHQWENPLNYAYLDVLHFNYPLVHNADMVKDAGYFYPDFNIKEGAKQLMYALEKHDDNMEDYNRKCDEVKSRYMADRNKGIVEIYDKLIENLWKPNLHKLSYEYDWKTNLYK